MLYIINIMPCHIVSETVPIVLTGVKLQLKAIKTLIITPVQFLTYFHSYFTLAYPIFKHTIFKNHFISLWKNYEPKYFVNQYNICGIESNDSQTAGQNPMEP